MADIIAKKLMPSNVLVKFLQDFSSKSTVLNYLFRKKSFIDSHENILVLSDFTINKISQAVNVPFDTTEGIINQCLLNIFYFKRALNCVRFIWNNNMEKLSRRLRVYLYKAYRIAPVFDYKRAKINSEILITLMNRSCYFPQFTTQLTIVIFVTDANNRHKIFDTPILQRNLRAFCDCSAFAFHRARNKLRINNQGKIY
ncbi:MAG: hypothetical protein ACFE8M_09835 [Candidatus Hermodarchaeota archaeon]